MFAEKTIHIQRHGLNLLTPLSSVSSSQNCQSHKTSRYTFTFSITCVLSGSRLTSAGLMDDGGRLAERSFPQKGQRKAADNNQNHSRGWTYSGSGNCAIFTPTFDLKSNWLYLTCSERDMNDFLWNPLSLTELQLRGCGRQEDFQEGLRTNRSPRFNVYMWHQGYRQYCVQLSLLTSAKKCTTCNTQSICNGFELHWTLTLAVINI